MSSVQLSTFSNLFPASKKSGKSLSFTFEYGTSPAKKIQQISDVIYN